MQKIADKVEVDLQLNWSVGQLRGRIADKVEVDLQLTWSVGQLSGRLAEACHRDGGLPPTFSGSGGLLLSESDLKNISRQQSYNFKTFIYENSGEYK